MEICVGSGWPQRNDAYVAVSTMYEADMASMTKTVNPDIVASLVLLGATLAALVCANTGLADMYKSVLYAPISLDVNGYVLADTAKNWVKNLLMAVFFLYVGLEIKAEFVEGALSDRRTALLPFAGAIGGMVVPACIFLVIAGATPAYVDGWAIPSATDIAFVIGIVALLGKSVPPALKAFLLAVAVIDDLGAILIVAAFYTHDINADALWLAALAVVVLGVMNRAGVMAIAPYLLVGVALWLCVQRSGVNPTLAGVITALFVPLRSRDDLIHPLHSLVAQLKFSVVFIIMPVFAFANAGVPLTGLGLHDLAHPITSGVAMGLLIGKPVGIVLMVYLAVMAGFARLPAGTDGLQMMGAGLLAGIGFTMSLFIGALAYEDDTLINAVRLGVLIGSAIAGAAGATVLVLAARRKAALQQVA
jgi:Na+:H+ antiporter, NhaA family